MANHLFEPGVGKFVGMLRTVNGDRGDRAGINELLDARAHRGIEKVLCAADVRIVNILLALGPQTIIGGNVEDPLGSLRGARDRCRVTQIARDVFERQIRDRPIGARGTQHHAHVFPPRHQLARHVAAQEARSAGHQDGHAIPTPSSCASPGGFSARDASAPLHSLLSVCDRSASPTSSEN